MKNYHNIRKISGNKIKEVITNNVEIRDNI